jgi:hypothetical protein
VVLNCEKYKLLGVLIEEKPWSEFLKRLAIKSTPEVSPKMLVDVVMVTNFA